MSWKEDERNSRRLVLSTVLTLKPKRAVLCYFCLECDLGNDQKGGGKRRGGEKGVTGGRTEERGKGGGEREGGWVGGGRGNHLSSSENCWLLLMWTWRTRKFCSRHTGGR